MGAGWGRHYYLHFINENIQQGPRLRLGTNLYQDHVKMASYLRTFLVLQNAFISIWSLCHLEMSCMDKCTFTRILYHFCPSFSIVPNTRGLFDSSLPNNTSCCRFPFLTKLVEFACIGTLCYGCYVRRFETQLCKGRWEALFSMPQSQKNL
jgi:hypothetical protein